MTKKDKQSNEVIRSTNKSIDKYEQTKKENNKVKNFFKKTQTIIAITIIVTLAAVYGAYQLYDHVYTTGYKDAVKEQAAIAKQVAELSKSEQ